MGLVEQAKIDASQISFSTRFNMALMAVEDPVKDLLAMEIPSSSAVEHHDWLGTVPGFQEWLDDRVLSNLRAESIIIRNKNWSNGIKIDRNDIMDDRLGIVMPRIDWLAQKAGIHYGQQIVDALIAGFTAGSEFGTAYDGQAFFSAAHADGEAAAQSNTAGSAALSNAAYFAARATMWSLVDEVGDELGITPNLLLTGPNLEELALQITTAELVPNLAGTASQTNVARGTARPVVSPRLIGTAANHWFVASTTQAVRSMILQIREAISTSMVGIESESVFTNRTMKFGAQARHAVGYGLWQFIHGSDN